MKTLIALFLPSGLIMLVAVIVWLVKFPQQVGESLRFEDPGLAGRLVSILTWAWFAGACATLSFLACLIAKSVQ